MYIKYENVNIELFNNLSKHILSRVVYDEFVTSIDNQEEISNDKNSVHLPFLPMKEMMVVENVESYANRLFTPKQEDTLFWCLFIHKFGEMEYNLIQTKYKNKEIIEKMKIVDYLNNNRTVLKSKKITKSATQEIMGKLMINSNTDLQSAHGICAFYNLHICVVSNSKRSYIEYNYSLESDNNEKSEILLIYKSGSLLSVSKSRYSIRVGTKTELSNITSDFIKFESFDKPFNGISSYKLSDLETFRKMLGLSDIIKNENKKKSDIYSEINIAVA